MTCEVALLNRRAVALAADSATTVSYWEKGERKERYFKGTNKLFNLSAAHPVGLLTYDSGNLQGVPWEVIVKADRDHVEDKSHDHIPGYGADLFEYIESNAHLYPAAFQEQQLLSDLTDTASRLVLFLLIEGGMKRDNTEAERKAATSGAFEAVEERVKSAAFIGTMSQTIADEISAKYMEQLKALFQKRTFINDNVADDTIERLARLAALGLAKKGYTSLNTTGIVIAGFGEKEFFPHLKQYTVYGLVLGKLVFEEGRDTIIDQHNVSEIVPLAQSEMVKTFIYGMMPGVLKEIDTIFEDIMNGVQEDLITLGKLQKGDDISELKANAKERFSDKLGDQLVENHTLPLRRVIGILPFDELADLAEILISIESLKERVTTTSESVGGPIDVAVISKTTVSYGSNGSTTLIPN
jgi:hypothetical protein